jgi:hypothetical protein
VVAVGVALAVEGIGVGGEVGGGEVGVNVAVGSEVAVAVMVAGMGVALAAGGSGVGLFVGFGVKVTVDLAAGLQADANRASRIKAARNLLWALI